LSSCSTPCLVLPEIKAPPEAQDVPLYSSVQVTAASPPAAKAAFWVPTVIGPYLAVDKTPPALHVEPSYSSVHALEEGAENPPAVIPAFCVPAPDKSLLTEEMLPEVDQLVPS
jgi:hypothetical protein